MRFTYFRYEEKNHSENEVWTRFIHVPRTDEDDSVFCDFLFALEKINKNGDFECSFEKEKSGKYNIYKIEDIQALIKENVNIKSKYPRYGFAEINSNIDFRNQDEESLACEIGMLGFAEDACKVTP